MIKKDDVIRTLDETDGSRNVVSPGQEKLHAACDEAVKWYLGEPVEVPLPEALSVQDLHAVVTTWRDMGWSVDADSGAGRLVLS